MKRLPHRPSSLQIEGIKKPPIDIFRREPHIATGYAEVVYTPGGAAAREQHVPKREVPADSPSESRPAPSRLMARAKSALRFVQGVVAGMALLATILLVHQELLESPSRNAVVPADAKTNPMDSASPPFAPDSNGTTQTLLAAPPLRSQRPASDIPHQPLEQELHELQAVNHLLTTQVEDLRRKLVVTKTDLSTMTATKEYYVQKVKEVEDALQDQKRQNRVAQRALSRALDQLNPSSIR